METLEIESSRDLTKSTLVLQAPGSYLYRIDRHRFISAYSARQHAETPSGDPLALATEAAEQIWMNERESAQVAAAIRAARPTVKLES